ncbi:cytochrome c oxidase, subunit II [Brevundimonas diminuta ATCC 11568]|nr:cytochrome c oxidase, subunit II [Brevundimonas diminuta ATCC 11568]
MAGWIADSQGIKPGNRMPSYPVLTGRELRDLASYLDSLK